MDKVTIQLDSKWVAEVHSPTKLKVLAALTGVSITFAPVFLFFSGYQVGRSSLRAAIAWVIVGLLCFASIHFVGRFFIRLGWAVVGEILQLRKH